jgi:hypothetical protein
MMMISAIHIKPVTIDEKSNHMRLDQLLCKSSYIFFPLTLTMRSLFFLFSLYYKLSTQQEDKTSKNVFSDSEWDEKKTAPIVIADECIMYCWQFCVLSKEFTVQTPLMMSKKQAKMCLLSSSNRLNGINNVSYTFFFVLFHKTYILTMRWKMLYNQSLHWE